MPALNVFCTCERIIIDGKGIPSLISLFQRMDLQLTETPFPEDLVAPARWVIFCIWQLSPQEVGTEFEQHTRIIRPNGAIVNEVVQPFRLLSDVDLHARTYIEMNGLHVGQQGFHRIQVWLKGKESEVREISFFINHLPMQAPPDAAQLNLVNPREEVGSA